MEKRPGRLRRFWRATRRRIPGLRGSEPLPGAAAALELPSDPDPQVYPTETDAVGEPFPDDEDNDSGRAAAL